LTLNTLLTDRELPKAMETAREVCSLGVDAILVQDWGLFELLRKSLPDLPLHASTQMSVFTSGGACELANDGCERIVIARENSKEDTAAICANCPVEVETFCHGALCMCYSGQCNMSALIGGRSGNRGRCAQPCRLPYGFNEPAKKKYPLSLKDNCLAHELESLEDMGIACLKLEGRMKRPEYVAVITRIYARLLEEGRKPTAAEQAELEQAFSRSGFTDWYWQGRHGAGMFGTRPENAPDPKALFDEARAAYEKDNLRTLPVRFTCVIRTGEPALLTAEDDAHTVTVTGAVPEAARNRAVTAEDIADRLKKTGGTVYRCEDASVTVDDGLSLPASAVNALRRDALAALTEARVTPPERRELPVPPLPEIDCSAAAPKLTVSVMRADQLTEELLSLNPTRVYVPLEVLAEMDALPSGDTEWCALLPRVWQDRNEAQLHDWLAHAKTLGVTAAAAGNIGHLSILRESGLTVCGDYGLNVFNARSLDYLRNKGLDSACLSFELRSSQMRDLQKILPAEAIVYGRLPLMITENCLVQNETRCKLDRNGPAVPASAPCRKLNTLVDRTGAAFPLLPAYGHRTEIQNSKTMWLADRPDWKRLGLTYARLRFTTETPEECVRVFRAYLSGAAAPGELTRGLFERGVE
ncbi:MAG: U32 family peptidase, partial [Oscillospiraceae bacterium]|nr:U32 family peptidase [Oscillospiraceae bacterium]